MPFQWVFLWEAFWEYVLQPVVKHPIRTWAVILFPLSLAWLLLWVEAIVSETHGGIPTLLAVIGILWVVILPCFAKAQYDIIAGNASDVNAKVYLLVVLLVDAVLLLIIAQKGESWIRWGPFITNVAAWVARPLMQGWESLQDRQDAAGGAAGRGLDPRALEDGRGLADAQVGAHAEGRAQRARQQETGAQAADAPDGAGPYALDDSSEDLASLSDAER